MNASFAIAKLDNQYDGIHARATLTGTPAADPTFWIARNPDVDPPFQAPANFVSPGVYDIAFPAPCGWYCWGNDSIGRTSKPIAEWVGLSDNPTLDECGLRLLTLLMDNKPLLDRLAAKYVSGETIKQILYADANMIKTYPSILITKPEVTSVLSFMPMGWIDTYTLTIIVVVAHQDRQSMIRQAARLFNAMQRIINQPAYESLTVGDGTDLSFCQIVRGDADDGLIDEQTWGAVASGVWSGEGVRQDTGGQA